MATKAVYNAIGRRKGSIARVYMTPGKGDISINGRPFKDYVLSLIHISEPTRPY